MRNAARYLNIAWAVGLLYFVAMITATFLIDYVKMYLMMKISMLCLAGALLISACGVAAYYFINRNRINARANAIISTVTIPVYILCFAGMFIAPSNVKFYICGGFCALALGFDIGYINSALSSALHQDRRSGLATGAAFVICTGLLSAAQATERRFLALAGAFIVTFYLYCRQPVRPFSPRARQLRKDLNIVVTKRAIFNQLLMVAMIGISCSAALSMFIPIYTASGIHPLLLPAVFWGLGMLAAGLLRDAMNRYMLMIPFGMLCALMVCSLGYTYNNNFWLMALDNFFRGAAIEYFLCLSIDMPSRKKFAPVMLNLCCIMLLGAMALSLGAFAFLSAVPGGRNILLAFKTLPVLLALVLMFFDSLYQHTQEPEMSFKVKLKIFCDERKLTQRESEVLELVLTSDEALKELTSKLYISISTLEKHMTNIYSKTGTKTRNELNYLFFGHKENADRKDA